MIKGRIAVKEEFGRFLALPGIGTALAATIMPEAGQITDGAELPVVLRVKSARLSNGKVTGHGRQEEREQVSWMGLCRGCPACPETL